LSTIVQSPTLVLVAACFSILLGHSRYIRHGGSFYDSATNGFDEDTAKDIWKKTMPHD
jgi:hypothetical protein